MDIILGVDQGKITVHLPGEVLTFDLDNDLEVADCLLQHPHAIILCSSSCDHPQDHGAPAGWKWDEFWANVCAYGDF